MGKQIRSESGEDLRSDDCCREGSEVMRNLLSALCMMAGAMLLLNGCSESHKEACVNRGGIVNSVDIMDTNGTPHRSYYCTVNGQIVDRW